MPPVSFSLMRSMPSVKAEMPAMAVDNDEREQTLNQLLAEMDGLDSSKGLIDPGRNQPSGSA